MYSERIINEKLARFHELKGWTPRRHSIAQVEEMNAVIESCNYTTDKGTFFDSSKWTPALVRWVENERAMCMIDCEYFLTRYYFIAVENDLVRFTFRSGQRVFYSICQSLEAQGKAIEIQILKARQQGLCLHPDTKILTADLLWKPLRDITVGEELVATDEFGVRGGSGKLSDRKMRTATVQATHKTFQKGLRLTLDNGVSVTCSLGHKWLSKKRANSETQWRRSEEFIVGDVIRYVTHPWGESTYEDGWFGGIIDGEGNMSNAQAVGCSVTVHQRYGRVWDRMTSYLNNEGVAFNLSEDSRPATPNGKLGRDPVGQLEIARMNHLFRVIGKCAPVRVRSRWWEGKGLPGKKTGEAWARVVAIEEVQEQIFIDLQTSTKTFIAEGLVSHNSTIVEGMMTHRSQFAPGVKCSIASADGLKTLIMAGMMYTALDHLPWWLGPRRTKDTRTAGQGFMEFSGISSSIVFQSGSMKGGIGQGTTPTAVHISEVCDFTNPVTQLEEGLFKAVHPSPAIFMVLESTGNGNTGWWADQWRANKEFYYQGRARFLPLFLPWFMTPELYPTPTWIKTRPVPKDWTPEEVTVGMAMKCKLYVASSPELVKVLGAGWELPRAQQWFWEVNFLDAKRRGREKSWLRQMPCDDFEALVGDNDTVFTHETLAMIERNRQKSYTAYGIVGEMIDERHDPPPFFISPDAPRLWAQWTTPKDMKMEWYFLPYRDTGEPSADYNPLKKLIIYTPPEPGADYCIGVDTAAGGGRDRSVITVTRTGYEAEPDVQVAEFASDDLDAVEIIAYVAAIGALYAKYMDEGQHPKFCIEQRRKSGDLCQHQLQLMGMRRHHEFIMYDKKGTTRGRAKEGTRLGWFTNVWSRPMLLGMFKYAVENGWYTVNSKWLAGEIEKFEIRETDGGKSRMDHVSGEHDDRIFSAAMSYFSLHDLDVMMERSKIRFNRPEEEEVVVSYSPYYASVEAGGGWEEAFGG